MTSKPFSEELRLSVPWGHIEAKAWGEKDGQPVLILHGIQDNCGSFDRLIPLLPTSFYYLCIDLPGHGKSSHFPSGVPLEFLNYVHTVKLIVDQLKWNTFIIMGHSLGAQIAVFFTSVYPDIVLKVICVDGLTPSVVPEKKTIDNIRYMYSSLQKLENTLTSKAPPSYTYEEAVSRLIKSRPTHLSQDSAEILVKRSLVPSGNGFMFSSDQRLKLLLRTTLTMQQMKNIVSNIKCPGIMFIAIDTYNSRDPTGEDMYHERLREIFFQLPNFSFRLVEGNHNMHMDHPERISAEISEFLLGKKFIKCSL